MTTPAIVIVTSSFPISGDGSEAAGGFVADLAEELGKHVPVRVVAPGRAGQRERWAANVEVYRFATPGKPLSTMKLWHPVGALQALRVMAAGQEATDRAMAAGPVAHVLALWALPCGEWARRAARRYGCGYSVWTLGSDIWSLGRVPLVRSRLRTILSDAASCWSDGLQLLEDTAAIAGREVGFLPSTRRIERVREQPLRGHPPYRLMFLGRWHPNKGADLLVDAIARLDDEDWARIERLTIAGGGPLDREVRAAVRKLEEAGRPVVLHGFLDRSQAQDQMLASDYLVIPSRIESIPVVFSDAMKLDLPVISTPVGDLPRLVEGAQPCGILAAGATSEDIAQAIRRGLEAAPERFRQGMAEVRTTFDVERSAARILAGVGVRIEERARSRGPDGP
jgi:glycosyltransferase involved in cell wall biosynthesis